MEIEQVVMISFHGKQNIKDEYLALLTAYRDANEKVKELYWSTGRISKCIDYESDLGIPLQISFIENEILKDLPKETAMQWPVKFIEAIPVGVDLSIVWKKFIYWLLVDKKNMGIKFFNKKGFDAIDRVANLYDRWISGDNPTYQEWAIVSNCVSAQDKYCAAAWAAKWAAHIGAWSEASAARDLACSAFEVWTAASEARHAERTAAHAASRYESRAEERASARDAVRDAARDAGLAAVSVVKWAKLVNVSRKCQSEKLLELLRELK